MGIPILINTPVPAKNLKRITIYVPPETFQDLEAWAEVEDRSLSNLGGRLVKDAVETAKRDGRLSKRTDGEKSS
ncbi:MAG: ribbon-helix-helix domain-containing protein [Pseudanabaenaceae cyanobacterium]|jgi:hypothetical protein